MRKIYKPHRRNHNANYYWNIAIGALFLGISSVARKSFGNIAYFFFPMVGIFLLAWGFYSWGPGYLQIDEKGLLFVKWSTSRRLHWHQLTKIKKDRFQHPNPKHCYYQIEIHMNEPVFRRADLWRYLNMINYVHDGTEKWQKKSKLKIEFEIGEQKWELDDLNNIQSIIEDRLKHKAEPVTDDE